MTDDYRDAEVCHTDSCDHLREARGALERLADRADEYRHAVDEANRYLNEDLPSAKSLVFALGKARAALREGGETPR